MKKALVAGILSLGLFSSCLGPNKWFNGLHDWNYGVSENRWVNEAVFLGLVIIPVYGIALLGDYIISNSIEWWNNDKSGTSAAM